jgi:pyruvate dehydrogenase E1 component alpha subunit
MAKGTSSTAAAPAPTTRTNNRAAKATGNNSGGKEAVLKVTKQDAAKYLSLYEKMVHIREFEELVGKEWNDKSHGMGGYLHLYSGEEAIAVGIIGALRKDDCFIGHYRDHGYALACGSDPGEVMAEICGRYTGCSKGKGGSMHICDAERGFYGGYGIVGGNVPIALGLGYAIKYRGLDQVCVCFFGDGSMNQGAFHETLNMAQLYRVPVLFVVENNGYAMGTSIERSHALIKENPDATVAERVKTYGMAHDTINGQNIVEVHERASEIIANMRKDPAPFFLECQTYRYHGHGAADTPVTQSTYRTQDEVRDWRTNRDPILIAEGMLMEAGVLTEDERKRIHQEALEAANAAMKFSDESPYPPVEELVKDVYA